MNQDELQVTRVKPFQWRELKAIRLEALRAEPAVFGASFEEAVVRPDDYWQHRITDSGSVHLIARAGRRPIGMVGAYLGPNDGEQDVAIVFGMYVTKEYRGRGAGRLLLGSLIDHVVTWFPEITTVRLWVGPEQTAAYRLYQAIGFHVLANAGSGAHPTGQLPPEIMMERPV